MSAFSRGFFLRPRWVLSTPKSFNLQFLTTPKSPLPRSFTTSQLLRHTIQKARSLPSKPLNGPLKKSLPQNPTYQSFADSLASKSHATLLYAAPPHTMYIVSSYTAAFFCFAYAGYNFNAHYMHPPPNLSPWIPIAFGVVCFGVACFGGYLVLGPARLIKTVTAIPPTQAQAVAVAKGVGKNGPGLAIEIELRKMLPIPFFPARKVIAKPEDLTLNRRVYVPPVDPRQAAVERLEERRRREREQEEERRKSIWWRPFRDANKAFHKLFMAMRLVWTRDSFLELAVKGSKYKLDIGGGWGLDEGRALDRLVRLKALN
jgi:hypothetical protein